MTVHDRIKRVLKVAVAVLSVSVPLFADSPCADPKDQTSAEWKAHGECRAKSEIATASGVSGYVTENEVCAMFDQEFKKLDKPNGDRPAIEKLAMSLTLKSAVDKAVRIAQINFGLDLSQSNDPAPLAAPKDPPPTNTPKTPPPAATTPKDPQAAVAAKDSPKPADTTGPSLRDRLQQSHAVGLGVGYMSATEATNLFAQHQASAQGVDTESMLSSLAVEGSMGVLAVALNATGTTWGTISALGVSVGMGIYNLKSTLEWEKKAHDAKLANDAKANATTSSRSSSTTKTNTSVAYNPGEPPPEPDTTGDPANKA